LAAKNRAWFAGREILALNLISSPGGGKTTLLERTIRDLANELPIYVIEGDQATAHDGERIRNAGAAAVQVNTGTGCHLDAEMVSRALPALKPALGAALLIENVGNLVCPALFDLGERAKVVIFPVTDGEDKPLKYPYIFHAAGIVLISKIDLLPHVDFAIADECPAGQSRCFHSAGFGPERRGDAGLVRLSARRTCGGPASGICVTMKYVACSAFVDSGHGKPRCLFRVTEIGPCPLGARSSNDALYPTAPAEIRRGATVRSGHRDERYPDFIPWMIATRVPHRTERNIWAELRVRGPLRKHF